MSARHSRLLYGIISLTLVVAMLAAGSILFTVNANQARATQICRTVNIVQAEIRGVLLRSRAALPENAYYKAHPEELGRAEAEVDREIQLFSPLHC